MRALGIAAALGPEDDAPVVEGVVDVTYLASMNVEETSHNQSPASIRVTWTYGDQRPDEVQIYVEPVNATALDSSPPAATVKVDKQGGQPTTADLADVPAPAQWQVAVAPR